MRFHGLGEEGWAPIPEVRAGEHYFVFCAAADGRLHNIIPHRYLVDDAGRIIGDGYFGVLSAEEIERFEGLNNAIRC
jgi:hypothetical protein